MIKKVIIADDEPIIRDLLGKMLGNVNGLECDLCKNAEQLLERIANTQYDFVLTDNDMNPGIKGIEAVRMIREMGVYKNTPIYVMSGREVGDEALQAGATGYIRKPFKMNRLIKLVERRLNPAHQQSQANSEQ